MPRKCSVIGCRANYGKRKSANDEDKACSVFRFPKDAGRLQEWLRKIPQENLTSDQISDYMGVCERHFDPRYIVRDYTFKKSDGTVFTSPRGVPVLSDDAVPTLFPNTPSYLSTTPPPKRRNPDDRRAEASARDDELLHDWLADDTITTFGLFQSSVQSKVMDLGNDWMLVTCKYDYVLFVNISLSGSSCPSICCSFKVLNDMTVECSLHFIRIIYSVRMLDLL